MMKFNNADPRHAKINPLRARRDKPHIWFQDGHWRISPMPIKRRRYVTTPKEHWARAHAVVAKANFDIHYKRQPKEATHYVWQVVL